MAVLRLEIGTDIRDSKDSETDLLWIREMADPEAEQSWGGKEGGGGQGFFGDEVEAEQKEWAEVTLKEEELKEREKQAVNDFFLE